MKKLDYVTHGQLTKVLEEYRIGIIREARVIVYEGMENAKVYFEEENKRYNTATQEEFEDKMLYYQDGVKMLIDKQSDCEDRISRLEADNI